MDWKSKRVLVAGDAGFLGSFVAEGLASKPNGQPRRRLSATRADMEVAYRVRIGLDDSLHKTWHWVQAQGTLE